jgi:hypothetical protein
MQNNWKITERKDKQYDRGGDCGAARDLLALHAAGIRRQKSTR